MGAELVRFSPIHDRELPEDLDGLRLSGGYPELNGEALEENQECAPDPGSYPGWNALSGRMWRIHVSSSGDGGYGRKAAQSLWGDPWKGLPDTEAEPVRLYHPLREKTGYRTW